MDASIDYVSFAKDFHNARWGRGLSQEATAKQLGISKSTVSRWENANTTISAAKLMSVCFYYDLNPYKYLIIHNSTKVQYRIETNKDQMMQEIYNDCRIEKITPPDGMIEETPINDDYPDAKTEEELAIIQYPHMDTIEEEKLSMDMTFDEIVNHPDFVLATNEEVEDMTYHQWRMRNNNEYHQPSAEDWQND